AVMMCSSATALHAIRKARMREGESVAVFGCGGLGTSAIQIAKILGAREVFGVDVHPDKLELASRLGATPIDATKSDAADIIMSITHGRGVDVALEVIGRPDTMRQAVRSVGVGGRVAIAGITEQAVEIHPYLELISKEAEVIGVSDHNIDEIGELLEWANEGTFDLSDIVTEQVKLDTGEINPVLDALARGAAAARTVILPLLIWASAILLGQSQALYAQEADSTEIPPVKISHGSKGFEFETGDGDFLLQIASRMQFRYAFPSDSDPITGDDFIDDNKHSFKINRARLKVGGHAFKPWFKYYWEFDVVGANLLDYRIMLERFEWLKLKVGQWKVQYNRERIISSGKQQLADRSIINRVFTIDRQQGISLFGRLRAGGPADFSYWLSVLTGTGRGGRENDDDKLMWMGRAQWNPLGRVVVFEGSDTRYQTKPAVLIAVAAVTNRSPYIRFSTGGGSGPRGEDGLPGQFRVDQIQIETAFMYRGFSWQHESHWKNVYDTVNDIEGSATGSYFQGGVFPHTLVSGVPPQLEIAARYAYYLPDLGFDEDVRNEITVGANWFFRRHRNKLTAEISMFDLVDAETGELAEELRVRLQWEMTL
ncbi:MAG: porin, partial [Rhodothermia bacterium]